MLLVSQFQLKSLSRTVQIFFCKAPEAMIVSMIAMWNLVVGVMLAHSTVYFWAKRRDCSHKSLKSHFGFLNTFVAGGNGCRAIGMRLSKSMQTGVEIVHVVLVLVALRFIYFVWWLRFCCLACYLPTVYGHDDLVDKICTFLIPQKIDLVGLGLQIL